MRKHRVYINQALHSGAQIIPSDQTRHYIQTVLRIKTGYQLRIFNGDGQEYNATALLDRRTCSIKVNELCRTETKKTAQTHLIQAIARGDHMDFAIQKATELDVDIITPVIASRTQHHDKIRIKKRLAHWHSIIINACEQSGRCYLPELRSICEFNQAIETTTGDIKFICQPGNNKPTNLSSANDVVILVGPEGGFNDAEIDLALAANYVPLSLGKNILRTETATTSALTIVNHLLSP